MAIIGIDLGTTNSLAAAWIDGKSTLIPNSFGEYSTPSVVSIDDDGQLYIGKTAKERLITHPDKTVSGFKRFMGTNKIYKIGDKEFSPIELSSLVLKKIKDDAEAYLGEEVTEAIVSVPAYFNNAQRDDTKRAGSLIGLNVNYIINEPSAAALAAQNIYPEEQVTEMVFDFGGGTLDVSIVDCFENVINVLAVSGDNKLGGIDFDRAISEYFCSKTGLKITTLSDKEREILLKSAEKCKRELTDTDSSSMVVNISGKRYEFEMTTDDLVASTVNIFRKIIEPVENVASQANVDWEEVNRVVLVGGSCKMPIVRMFIKHRLKKMVIYQGSPDTIVAYGAGVYAGIVSRSENIKDTVLTDVCPFTLGVGIIGNRLSPVITKNSALPTSKSDIFVTTNDNQDYMIIDVYQGESLDITKNILLGEFKITIPKNLAGKERVEVRFTYDINGILEVEATSLSTSETKRIVIVDDRNDMSQEEITKRLEELASLKIHPKDVEENTFVLARAEALYEMGDDRLREFLSEQVRIYKEILYSQDEIQIKKKRKYFNGLLDHLEENLHIFKFEPDDDMANWYKEAMEEEARNDEKNIFEFDSSYRWDK